MNIKEVKDLIQEILRSDISEFELEHTGTRLKLSRGFGPHPPAAASASTASLHHVRAAAPEPEHTEVPQANADANEESQENHLYFITSPIVGTFYRAPTPKAKPYVEIGQMIQEGTVLCIVEAMKIMNEIPTDVSGEVVGIYAENNEPVEYGQKLFGIRTRK